MTKVLLEWAEAYEAQAMALVGYMDGTFPRDMTAEAADLFVIATALRARASSQEASHDS